ncbi:ATP-binding cassette domain-containing protein [Streptococcus sciuri]|uniref:ABC transporter ATP-binding protein n=1 Tax=Streptococcus sciuri TaxID=2973939 RepID=A0ABT2F731_9STRE|nr:ABC transporter ATP-binding protein [Streptococcus sciuri]MCS4488195.1 ABC transporter ATP-binding protein [Streptococcus sciuri]
MIHFSHVNQQYGEKTVLSDITFNIKQGEFFVLVGPSGSGKTTLLKMLNRLIEPTSGSIMRYGVAINTLKLRQLRLETGYVLQQIALFPNLTVAENIELIPEMKGWEASQRREASDALLQRVGLEPNIYRHRYPRELSGGEQQRIGILRAIIAKPKLLLMDEPFSALDPISRRQLQELTKSLQKEIGMTLVFVTHDMKEALQLADRICIINQGKVIQVDTPQAIKENPQNDFVASLFNTEN